ncbi:oxidoreductase alpha (molybdopterin) subunit [Pseudoxanthomonas sp. GM95]|uniref:FdhF/YdeP family oxidoreductase n=1 Tax=Pseudoxanthomonas sp. GM95 TaxID=1881043 RepID=UPI0008C7C45B|nr:FdhF/YdeP family oxidoreductase [Pseudoxanthomonas sp. GM95]SEL61458.1 oxidoreductase alpha (molybdopterin) subunit [Pseudoxanthomonas sp. GM95]
MSNDDVQIPGVQDYDGPAGGWGALRAVAKALKDQMGVGRETSALRRVNQPLGFDCPGCAWPDPKDTSSFEFCENGAKAVSWEATTKRATPDFFARHTLAELWKWSDHQLEDVGRLTHPMVYDHASDRYVEISWDDAFARIGTALRALPHPDMAEFYTSGRASNEAAFLYQLMVREYGTNNFPDCSNMCHEATSVGLPQSIGVGKGTVTLEDFDHCDALFSFGHNPGTNHPRMLTTLRAIAKRGVPIIAVNPLKERGLERFVSPQHPAEMLTNHATQIAQTYYQVKVGGDAALLKGMMKWLFDTDAAEIAAGGIGLLDRAFIEQHTDGLDALRADIEATRWDDIVRVSGLSRADIEAAAQVYAKAERVIICYGMGMTQHQGGTHNVQLMADLLLLRGNIGKPGAGIAPIRGHSNVQGDRTVGITEKPNQALADGIRNTYGFEFPLTHGHDAVEALRAIRDGRSKALVSLGGNLAVAMPDPQACFAAMRTLDLAVHIATKPNRSHLIPAKEVLLLPCLGRTERDEQASGLQSVTVEDSMSMVHASQGGLTPASEHLLSEPAIVARMAIALLPDSKVDWQHLVDDYDRIRDGIEAVFPIFKDYNQRIRVPGGFRLPVGASTRDWGGPGAKAHFLVAPGLAEDAPTPAGLLTMTTLRAHDQYNTTIYGLDDRYRGVRGRRDVVFLNRDDLTAMGLEHGDAIDVASRMPGIADDGHTVRNFTAVAYDIPRGCAAMYYPEGNCLVPLDSHDPQSGTPTYKSVPVQVSRAA